MAKPKSSVSAPTTPAAPAGDPPPEVALTKYLNATKSEHYNFVEDTNYLISSGSLNLDAEIGGFGPSLVRLQGPASAGKSSFSLNVARHFLQYVPNSRAIYVKSEGRLSAEIRARSGLTYVTDPTEWRNGTVFVFECNIYETIIGLMRELISNNPHRHVYMFIVDSMDGLNLRDDMAKATDQANKVAGAPKLTKEFLQKMSVALTKYGHLCFMLGQVSAEIKLDPYAKGIPRQVAGSGGNAVQHFASTVLAFQEWYESDLILEDPDSRVDRVKNRPLGHVCKVKLAKSDKEKRHITVEIPIKHGVTNGSAVWKEREIADQLLGFGLITKKGGWLTLTEALKKELIESGAAEKVPDQINGLNQLYLFLETNSRITDYLFERFKAVISGAARVATEPAVVVAA